MRYPLGLPKELQRPVEVARDKAEMLLLEALSNRTAHRLNEAFHFIGRVFPAFAHQACEAERQGHWQGHEGREAVETFLERQLIPHAYELARVSTFVPAPIHPPLSLAAFRHRVMEFIKESDMWRQYLAERRALGDAPARKLNEEEEAHAAAVAAGPTPYSAPSDSRATPITAPVAQDSSSPAPLPTTTIGDVRSVQLAPTPESLALALSESRKRVVDPRLSKKGWSPRQWAIHAGVDPSVIYGYLSGTSKPHAENRKAIAEALNLAEPDLPE